MSTEFKEKEALFQFILRLADDRLILGHRLSEWCGHAPMLEEDIALANMALDLIGQANLLLTLAGEIEGAGRSSDDLAYLRDERKFYNLQLTELPRGDFAYTIARQFFFAQGQALLLEVLGQSGCKPLADIALKSAKENAYHLRHARSWMLRLGDGTEESNQKLRKAVEGLWPFTSELFYSDDCEKKLTAADMISADFNELKSSWEKEVSAVLSEAKVALPEETKRTNYYGRNGFHTENLGHLLAEMQSLPRAHPGAEW